MYGPSLDASPLSRLMPVSAAFTYSARAVLPEEFVVEADAYGSEYSSKMYFTERDCVKVTP